MPHTPQARICLQRRGELWRLLYNSNADDDVQALQGFSGQDHILRGMTDQWLDLASLLSQDQGLDVPLPDQGHVFIEACVGSEEHVLRRLLWHVGVDMEQQWELPGQSLPWSAWVWVASNVMRDGAVEKPFVDQTWEVLLPYLVSAGFDLDKPTGFPSGPSSKLTRAQWLERQGDGKLEKVMEDAFRISMHYKWPLPSFNSASRRL